MRPGRANGQRGEIEAMIDGERRILCMTLGALAELETAFGVDNIADLAGRFSGGRVGAKDVMAIIAAGLRGGGNLVDDGDLRDCRVEGGVGGAIRLAADLLGSAFAAGEQPQNPS
ncbi:gene transfer agent family protein [Rhizobium sp.]